MKLILDGKEYTKNGKHWEGKQIAADLPSLPDAFIFKRTKYEPFEVEIQSDTWRMLGKSRDGVTVEVDSTLPCGLWLWVGDPHPAQLDSLNRLYNEPVLLRYTGYQFERRIEGMQRFHPEFAMAVLDIETTAKCITALGVPVLKAVLHDGAFQHWVKITRLHCEVLR